MNQYIKRYKATIGYLMSAVPSTTGYIPISRYLKITFQLFLVIGIFFTSGCNLDLFEQGFPKKNIRVQNSDSFPPFIQGWDCVIANDGWEKVDELNGYTVWSVGQDSNYESRSDDYLLQKYAVTNEQEACAFVFVDSVRVIENGIRHRINLREPQIYHDDLYAFPPFYDLLVAERERLSQICMDDSDRLETPDESECSWSALSSINEGGIVFVISPQLIGSFEILSVLILFGNVHID